MGCLPSHTGTSVHPRPQKTFRWGWFYGRYYTLQRQMADLTRAQSWQVLGNACYTLWQSSINKCWGYQQNEVSIGDLESNSPRQDFPNQVQTRGPATLVAVNGVFCFQITCFLAAPGSWDLGLLVSHSFRCTYRCSSDWWKGWLRIRNLFAFLKGGKSNQRLKRDWEILMLSLIVWEEWRFRWACVQPARRTWIRLAEWGEEQTERGHMLRLGELTVSRALPQWRAEHDRELRQRVSLGKRLSQREFWE